MLKDYFEEVEYASFKESNDLIYKSLEIVCRLFKDKTDKSGIPYSVHLLTVYEGVSNYVEKVVALLHDVLEDTDVTKEELRDFGYNDEIIAMLDYLTKRKGEDYRDYIERIIMSNNEHVLNVKLADLRHNMNIKRIKNPTINDYERVTKRYAPSYEKIKNKLDEMKEKNNVRH